MPQEIVLVFTLGSDETFVGTETFTGLDSNFFGTRSADHGEWVRSGPRDIRAASVLLLSAPTGAFVGGFKNLVDATLDSRDAMSGTLELQLYVFTDGTGQVILDGDGFPTPSPLAPASACSATPGCFHLGAFSFLARRVNVQ